MAQHLTTIDCLLLPTYNVLLLNVLLTTYLRARSAEDLDVPVLPDELGVAGVDQVQDVARLHDSDELRLCCDSHRAGLGSVGVVQYSRVIVEYSTVQYCAVCIV